MRNYWFLITTLLIVSTVRGQDFPEPASPRSDNEKFFLVKMAGINSIGDFKEDWKRASGFYAGYGIIYSDNGSLLFQTGYIKFEANENAGLKDNSRFSMIPLLVGGRYYILKDRFRPFLHAMSGYNIINQDWAGADSTITGSESHLAFQVGVGLDIVLFSGLQLEVSGHYNSHLLDPPRPYNITGLEYNVGLIWRLSNPGEN